MNEIFKIFLSMSVSGGLLILALLLGKRFLKDKLSRQWQYYIWLVVILRLLLPFGSETNLLGKTYEAVDQAITRAAPLPAQLPQNMPENLPAPAVRSGQNIENGNTSAEETSTFRPLQDMGALLTEHVWLIWLVAAAGLLMRKVTIYQGFTRYIKAGVTPVSDMEMLDRLSVIAEEAGVKKPVELYVNPLISSPLLTGFFRPCIVLPGTEYGETEFRYIVLHELIHYKRRDMFYKWLVQLTVCLHWFNPLVHLMSREITKACEFSCDEAVLAKTGGDSARDYGKTLLDAMAAVGKYRENTGAVTLNENKQLLKERLGAIMKFTKPSKAVRMATAALTLCVVLGAAFVGVYTMGTAAGIAQAARAASLDTPPDSAAGQGIPWAEDWWQNAWKEEEASDSKYGGFSSEAERCYEAGSLPLFQIEFSRMDQEEQDKWLDRIYADNKLGFWGTAMGCLEEDCALIRRYAEKCYEDGSIAWFSVLAMYMSEETLEEWLDKALEDGNWGFQSVLYNNMDRGDELDERKEKQEKEWEEAQKAEYEAAGIAMDGKNYYYQGQLVNIFLDIRGADKSFYTLDMNPAGIVNIRVIRDENDQIIGVSYMTDAEVTELFGEDDREEDDKKDDREDGEDKDGDAKDREHDDDDEDEEDGGDADDADNGQNAGGGRTWYPQMIPVNLETVADGEVVWLGEYTLSEGDRFWYAVHAETGNCMQVGFAEPEDELLNTVYYFVSNQRQEGESLDCVASMKFGPPAKPGTYKLFLRAKDGDLENVTGSISIGYVADAF